MEAAMPNKTGLDPLEKAVEADSAGYTPITGEKRKRIDAIVGSGRKSKNVNIRISEYDLASLKTKAEQQGLPYQTLITSVLHRFVTDRLVDEADVRKALNIVADR
jgi:hypothetical protein